MWKLLELQKQIEMSVSGCVAALQYIQYGGYWFLHNVMHHKQEIGNVRN